MFAAYTPPSYFYEDQEVSATALKILRNNTLILDTMAQRGYQAQRVRDIATNIGTDPHPIWRGSFQYKIGLTDAVIKLYCAVPIGETLVIKFNGITVYSAAMSVNNTATIPLPAIIGYPDNNIMLVDVYADFASFPATNQYVMQEAYVTPVSGQFSATWTAPATFGDITRTNMNKLVDAQHYLYYLLSSPAMPLQMSNRYTGGWWLPEETPDVFATYRFARHGNNDRLRVILDYRSRHNLLTTIAYHINGVSVASFQFGQWQSGTDDRLLDISGLTLDAPARLEIVETINTPATDSRGAVNTKYNIRLVETVRNAGYIAPTLPTETAMLESMTFSTLQDRLNGIGTALSTLKTDTDNRAVLLNRSYMFSRRPLENDGQEETLKSQYIARKKRQGEVLVVRGKNLRIGWGYETKVEVDKPEYTFLNEESLTSGETSDTKVFYLDRFDGLEVSFPYFIMGDVIEYAAEYFRY